jgi:hypothetical protein
MNRRRTPARSHSKPLSHRHRADAADERRRGGAETDRARGGGSWPLKRLGPHPRPRVRASPDTPSCRNAGPHSGLAGACSRAAQARDRASSACGGPPRRISRRVLSRYVRVKVRTRPGTYASRYVRVKVRTRQGTGASRYVRVGKREGEGGGGTSLGSAPSAGGGPWSTARLWPAGSPPAAAAPPIRTTHAHTQPFQANRYQNHHCGRVPRHSHTTLCVVLGQAAPRAGDAGRAATNMCRQARGQGQHAGTGATAASATAASATAASATAASATAASATAASATAASAQSSSWRPTRHGHGWLASPLRAFERVSPLPARHGRFELATAASSSPRHRPVALLGHGAARGLPGSSGSSWAPGPPAAGPLPAAFVPRRPPLLRPVRPQRAPPAPAPPLPRPLASPTPARARGAYRDCWRQTPRQR